MTILRELLFRPNAKFRDINSGKTSSDQFSYHLNVLIESGYVTKGMKGYSLTVKGKEYANTMDTDTAKIEKQPKVAVMLVGHKLENGIDYYLVQKRTKEPYFGNVGFISGKIRYGEKFFDTARRELKEEAGLDCEKFVLKELLHSHIYHKENSQLLEDKIFFLIVCEQPFGELRNTENGEVFWVTEEEFNNLENKYYDEDLIFNSAKSKKELPISEESYYIDKF